MRGRTAPPPVGYVRMFSNDPPLAFTCRLGMERPTVTGGYGGWEEIERPQRRPLTTWKGAPALRMTLPLMFDGFADNVSVESRLWQLEKMTQARAANGEPPIVVVQATGGHISHQDVAWVIEALDWGDALMNGDGNRVRQQVTVSLLQHIADVLLEDQAAKRRRQAAKRTKRPGAAAKRVVAKKRVRRSAAGRSVEPAFDGEDLVSIALRELGDADRWPEIAALNGMRDPRATVKGQVIRLP